MKLEIGAGDSRRPGYVHTDLNLIPNHHVEIVCQGEFLPFSDGSFDEVYMQGVFEHFGYHDANRLLIECHRVLQPNGVIDFTTPDLYAVCRIIVEDRLPFIDSYHKRPPLDYALSCLYGGQDRPGQIHKWGWTKERITEKVAEYGFRVLSIANDTYEPNTHLHVIAVRV